MNISIVLVHYNTAKETEACLQSLQKLKSGPHQLQVVVVDNGSSVPFEYTKTHKNFELKIIRSESNLGFTGGNNLAIHRAIELYNSDYLFLLNNDTIVDPDCLLRLLDRAESEQTVGIVSPKIYFAPGNEYHKNSYSKQQQGKVVWYAGGGIDWQNLVAFHHGVDEVDYQQFEDQRYSQFATGCAALVKREVLEKIGYFDKRFFLYFEDVDLSVRAKEAGYLIGFEPSATVWHVNAGSSGGAGSALHQYYQTRNRLLFTALHGKKRRWLTVLRLIWQLVSGGGAAEQLAVWHFFSRQFGKQPVFELLGSPSSSHR